jgi:leader peptidase (prepilin peptidase)/N-methyltransferase
MGWGDVKYVFFLGLALGYPNLLVGLFLAFLLGAITALILVAFKRKEFGQTIPFGPFLSLGAFIALLWGSKLLDFYLQYSLGLGY